MCVGVGEESVAYASFEATQRLLVGFSFFGLAVVVGPAFAVAETDLGDDHHVDGVVQPAVAAPGEPEDLVVTRGDFDGRGAGHVRPDAEDLGDP
jgi:hypothetical protein